jgi:formylmethanofuran--tetrahydromethanopterin N-formyltransferase
MIINGVIIDATFAEAFPMKATRVIITSQTAQWAYHAAQSMTGFATSVLGCSCEAGIERFLEASETPNGRPGVAVMIFTMSEKGLVQQLASRTEQCVFTTPTCALFSGIEGGKRIPFRKHSYHFDGGFPTSNLMDGNVCLQIPEMESDILIEQTTGQVDAVGGGNLLVLAESTIDVLIACEKAVAAIHKVPNVILPFPGGIVRSGSKIGSNYKALRASTNAAFCPTLKGIKKTKLSTEIEAVMEIVIDGLTEDDITKAMRVGIEAICSMGARVKRITAGNYGGKLGPYHFHLQEIMA